jgi:hypothetical protein
MEEGAQCSPVVWQSLHIMGVKRLAGLVALRAHQCKTLYVVWKSGIVYKPDFAFLVLTSKARPSVVKARPVGWLEYVEILKAFSRTTRST